MSTKQQQKPPPGFCFIEDAADEDGNVIAGIATRLGITTSTYRKWRMAGKGPASVLHGKRVMARITAIDDYLGRIEEVVHDNHESRPPERRIRRAVA